MRVGHLDAARWLVETLGLSADAARDKAAAREALRAAHGRRDLPMVAWLVSAFGLANDLWLLDRAARKKA
jgi:hypothetical protein